MALLDHCPAPDLPLRKAQRHVSHDLFWYNLFYLLLSLLFILFYSLTLAPNIWHFCCKSRYNVCTPQNPWTPITSLWSFAMTHGSTKTPTDCPKHPWGWVMLKSFILYDWVSRCFQRLNHPNRITCHKAGLRSLPPQPVTPLTATPRKATSTAVSGIVFEKVAHLAYLTAADETIYGVMR